MRNPLSNIKKYADGGYVDDDSFADDEGEDYVPTQLYGNDEPPAPVNDKFFPLLPSLGYKESTIPLETRNRMALEAARQFFAPAANGGGGNFTSDVSNVLGGVGGILDKNQQQRKVLEALRIKNAAAVQVGEARNKASLDRTKMITKARIEAAKIAAGSKGASGDNVRTLSPEEVTQLNLPKGTVAQHDIKTGRVSILYSPPKTSNAGQVVGYKEDGTPIIGQPMSKKVAGELQKYVINAETILPELDGLIAEIESGNTGQSALGITGAAGRAIESTVGQAKNLVTGESKALFPENAKFRSRLKKLNERLIPTLTADPRIAKKTRDEIKNIMVDPDKWGEDIGTALEKLKGMRTQLSTTSKQYKEELGETQDEAPPTPKTKPTNNPFEGKTKEQVREMIRKMSPEERAAMHTRMTNEQ